MEYLVKFEKWLWSKPKKEPEDLKQIVESQLEDNPNIFVIGYRYAKEIKSRIIVIPYGKSRIIVKRIGNRCQIKKDGQELEIDVKDFTNYWRKCIEKKFRIIYK